MKAQIKKIIIFSLISGLMFTGLLAVYDYYAGKTFSIREFILRGLYFAIVTGLFDYYYLKKQAKKKNGIE